VGQAGAGDPGTSQMRATHDRGQIRNESPGIASTDPGGNPPRTAANDTHRSVGRIRMTIDQPTGELMDVIFGACLLGGSLFGAGDQGDRLAGHAEGGCGLP
jgi:hypothetical protein